MVRPGHGAVVMGNGLVWVDQVLVLGKHELVLVTNGLVFLALFQKSMAPADAMLTG